MRLNTESARDVATWTFRETKWNLTPSHGDSRSSQEGSRRDAEGDGRHENPRLPKDSGVKGGKATKTMVS